jgi:hypothetical protein
MNILTKSLLGAGAAAAALVTVAAPVQAQGRYDRYDRNRDGISAGEVIAGAVILGGIAAVIASSGDDRYDNRNYNRGYNNGGYNNGGYNIGNGSRRAVNQCVNTVENWANGYSRSDVTQISNIERTRYGYRVTGKLVVQDGWRGNNRGYGNDRYDRDDRYGRNDRNNGYGNQGYRRGYDKGRFTCFVERGRVVDIDYRGLEQWR